MSSSGFFSPSPAMVMPPQQSIPDQYFHNAHYRNASAGTTPSGLSTPQTSLSIPPIPSEGALAGKKRSRGDVHSPEEELDEPLLPETANSYVVNSAQPNYGSGVTLMYPNDAKPQSSAWDEAQAEAAATQDRRPILPTRKSQRLDSSPSRKDDLAPVAQAPRTSGSEPLIDEASRMLGVSWSRLDATENTKIAQRAYTRWVSRHYPMLSSVELWFENSAIPGYLGKGINKQTGFEEYYLWSFDLHQAILVTRNSSDLMLKLSSPHMSLSQATDRIHADIEPVVEATAANAQILRNDRFIIDDEQVPGGMEVD